MTSSSDKQVISLVNVNDIWFKRVREAPRKIYKYNQAQWDNIKSDLEKTLQSLKQDHKKDINSLWNTFKVDLLTSIEKNVPTKMITYKHRLPWVTNSLRKLINRKNKAYNNRKKNPNKYKELKRAVQKESRSSYWNYIERIITSGVARRRKVGGGGTNFFPEKWKAKKKKNK